MGGFDWRGDTHACVELHLSLVCAAPASVCPQVIRSLVYQRKLLHLLLRQLQSHINTYVDVELQQREELEVRKVQEEEETERFQEMLNLE